MHHFRRLTEQKWFKGLLGATLGGFTAAIVAYFIFSAVAPVANDPRTKAVRLSALVNLILFLFIAGATIGWTGMLTGRFSAIRKRFLWPCGIAALWGFFSGDLLLTMALLCFTSAGALSGRWFQ